MWIYLLLCFSRACTSTVRPPGHFFLQQSTQTAESSVLQLVPLPRSLMVEQQWTLSCLVHFFICEITILGEGVEHGASTILRPQTPQVGMCTTWAWVAQHGGAARPTIGYVWSTTFLSSVRAVFSVNVSNLNYFHRTVLPIIHHHHHPLPNRMMLLRWLVKIQISFTFPRSFLPHSAVYHPVRWSCVAKFTITISW